MDDFAIVGGYDDEIQRKYNIALRKLQQRPGYLVDLQVQQMAMPVESPHSIHYVCILRYRRNKAERNNNN